jgi:hypothetical protein
MDNKIPGTPIVFVLNGGTPWTQTKGTAPGQPWPSPDPASDLPYIKHYNRYFGQVQNSWGWASSEVSYDSVPDATRSVWAASTTHVFIYLGIGTVAISGVDTRQPFFERMCL